MVWNLDLWLGGVSTYSLPLVEAACIIKLEDQVVRDSPSSPFWVVDIVFESINLIVELGNVELLQGAALDGPDTISTGICHNPRVIALKNELDHTLIDTNTFHLRELNEYSHTDVSIRSMDVVPPVMTTMAKVGSNTL